MGVLEDPCPRGAWLPGVPEWGTAGSRLALGTGFVSFFGHLLEGDILRTSQPFLVHRGSFHGELQ